MFIVLVLADQYCKYLAVLHLRGKSGRTLIPGVLELLYVENYGAAFGMFQNMRFIFIVIAVVILAGILYILFKMPDETRYRYLNLVLTILAAGACGNLIDRISSVYVVDFIYFSLIDFPVFNMADIYVTVSAACLFLLVLFYYSDADLAFVKPPEKATDTAETAEAAGSEEAAETGSSESEAPEAQESAETGSAEAPETEESAETGSAEAEEAEESAETADADTTAEADTTTSGTAETVRPDTV